MSNVKVKVSEIPNIGIHDDGFINLLCEGKRVSFYLKLLYLQTAALVFILLCCLGSLVWFGFFRNVSQLLNKMEKSKIDWDVELETNEGQDFLFLFDLSLLIALTAIGTNGLECFLL